MSDKGQSSSPSCGVKRAMLVGLRYDEPKMLFTHDDCKRIKKILMEDFEFLENNITMILDERESSENNIKLTNVRLEELIRKFVKETKQTDVSILYVSGHGGDPKYNNAGLLATVDYKAMEVKRIINQVKKLPKGTKFLFFIDACFGADFMRMFDEKVVMLIAAQEYEAACSSFDHGSHFTNSFIRFVKDAHEENIIVLLEAIKTKLRNLGIDQTPRGLCVEPIRELPISHLFKH